MSKKNKKPSHKINYVRQHKKPSHKKRNTMLGLGAFSVACIAVARALEKKV